MENILPRREARENAFLLAFSQTFGDVPLAEALTNHAENDEEHPVDGFSKLLLNAYYDHSAEVDDEIRAHLRNWTMEHASRRWWERCWICHPTGSVWNSASHDLTQNKEDSR